MKNRKIPVIGISDEGVRIVYHKGDIVIGYDEAIFMNGFNIYKRVKGTDKWEKANPRMQFYTSFDAARKFAELIK
ncbi:hypothetical protein HY440_01160 [Candidatus Microgenomates bacterium]|nr:hypothetical protein [Candidatus Microgenomates bacterium]